MAVPLTDPRFAAVPVRDCGEPLAVLGAGAPLSAVTEGVSLRSGVVDRLVTAQSLLPRELRLLVLAGYRTGDREAAAGLGCRHPRSVDLPPHLTGGAVDLTVVGPSGAVPALPPALDPGRHALLHAALRGCGLIAHPSQWWHWSYGDQYWAFVTNAGAARYGALEHTA
jgi:D-alanyl-D-alanine dipeptidase